MNIKNYYPRIIILHGIRATEVQIPRDTYLGAIRIQGNGRK